MLSQKGSAILVLTVGILLISIIAAGGYYYQLNNSKPVQVKTQSNIKSSPKLPESKTDADFAKRQYDINQKFFESESYPLEITSVKESDLIGMKCSTTLTCLSPYESCTYYPRGADTSKAPQSTTDPKILSVIKQANTTIDQTLPIPTSIEEGTFCEITDGSRLLRYKTPGSGGGAGGKEYIGVANKDGAFTKVSSISEPSSYFRCTSPLQLTKDRVLYYECAGGTQGMGGGKSIYKINLNANLSSLLKKCISVLDESTGTKSVYCNDGEIEKYGQFIVSTNFQGDKQLISIKRLNGEVVTPDVIEQNYEAIKNNLGKLGLKGSGMIGYAVGLGSSDSVILLEIKPADGSKFEVEVETNTGKIIEITFTKK